VVVSTPSATVSMPKLWASCRTAAAMVLEWSPGMKDRSSLIWSTGQVVSKVRVDWPVPKSARVSAVAPPLSAVDSVISVTSRHGSRPLSPGGYIP
jgi:hypothetical protein